MNKNIKKALVIFSLILLAPIGKANAEDLNLRIVDYPYSVYPLPGGLSDSLVANSNSPEIIKTEGILLSTFPKEHHAIWFCFLQAHIGQSLAESLSSDYPPE